MWNCLFCKEFFVEKNGKLGFLIKVCKYRKSETGNGRKRVVIVLKMWYYDGYVKLI